MSVQKVYLPDVNLNQADGNVPINVGAITHRALLQPTALNIITALPGSPTEGDVYLVANGGVSGALIGNENRIAVRSTSTWVYLAPLTGWKLDMLGGVYNGQTLRWNGLAWTVYVPDETLVKSTLPSGNNGVDRTVALWSGTTGRLLGDSRVFVDDVTWALYGFAVKKKVIPDQTYTIEDADCGKLLLFTSNLPVTVLAPQQSNIPIRDGFQCALRARGTGKVTITVEGTDVLESVDGYPSLRTQHAPGVLTLEIAAAPNVWSLIGDLGP